MSSSTSSSSRGRLGKAPLAVAVALGLLLASAIPMARLHWDRWFDAGRGFVTSERLENFLSHERRTGAPLVLAIGDSTLRPPVAFPTQMGARVGKAVEVRTVWGSGLSPSEAAMIAAAGLELEPAAVILLAHFATFEASSPLRYPDLVRIVPYHRLPDLWGLPYSSRGLGASRLVAGSLAGALFADTWLRVASGGVEWSRNVLEARWNVDPGSQAFREARYRMLRVGAILRSESVVHPGHPSVEMLSGAVRMIERAGAEALVVINPVNVTPLELVGRHDPQALARRVALVTERIESAGGDVVDVHDQLAPEDFADELGHYTGTGARRISFPVEDWTRRVLGLPPRSGAAPAGS